MLLLYHVIASVLLLNICGLNAQPSQRKSISDAYYQMINTLKSFINDREDGRRYDSAEYKKNYLRETLKMDMSKEEYSNFLRQQVAETTRGPLIHSKDQLSQLVENELKYTFAKKSSALFDRPFLLKKGKQDFLVIHPGNLDPFVTVLPNDIYYNIERTCVNWLEDCNLQGIRSRLLQKIRSPYV